MSSMVDSLFDQYESGRMTRRNLVQALAALILPATVMARGAAPEAEPLVRGLGVNHIGLTVSDVDRSYDFYHKLFGVAKGWPATSSGPGIHLDFPVGYISVDLPPAGAQKGVITHFSVSVDHIDQDSSKKLADKINAALPDCKARAAYQANDGVSTVNLVDPDGVHVQISPKDGK